MKTKLFTLLAFCALTFGKAQTTVFSEGFESIALPGWTLTNQSDPVGLFGWFEGNPGVFGAQAGPPTSYIAANYNNTAGENTISNWLITPKVMVQDGDVLKFWTRTLSGAQFPDRLEVRSSSDATFTTPSGPTGLGSFNTLLLEINPRQLPGANNYPDTWTEFTITLAGVSATPVELNFAFRYFVELGGPNGSNSNYIGIDSFSIVRPGLAVSNVNKAKVSIYPNPTTDFLNLSTASKISKVEVFDISGRKVKAELVDNKVNVQNLEKGSYVIKITDSSGETTQKFIKD